MGDTGQDARYWAFISYSHKDAAFARRLHRQLEAYAIPRRLVGQPTRWGTVPKKIAPIFRDREEFSAAHDLSSEVRAALKASRTLIVVCSPAAAVSRWVSREVDEFRALHPDRPVLAAIRSGEPSDCFPAPLRPLGPDGAAIEPLAADFRRAGGDGERLGLLKLVAGVLGIGLDALAQRDAHRRLQRVTAVTAGTLAAMLAMGVLTVFAVNARLEAERQRGQAEGLVEYMLTDLREKLKGVGRLDVMTAVNERALHYYAEQDLDRLPVDSLERHARVLHAMGEDDESRGDHKAALTKFREAERTTAELLGKAPDDPERIFNQAQSEFWLGAAAFNGKHYAAARIQFLAYKRHAQRMVALAPRNPKYREELGYADSNLCTLALAESVSTAIGYCRDSLSEAQRAVRGHESEADSIKLLIERRAWLADAYFEQNQPLEARKERTLESGMLDGLLAKDPNNADMKATWLALHIGLAEIDHKLGQTGAAIEELRQALSVAEKMETLDPSNTEWRDQRKFITTEIARWQAQAGTKQEK